MKKAIIFLFFLPFGFILHGQELLTNSTQINITEYWSQEPSGWTYPMAIHVPEDPAPEDGYPVCIALHGNGGNGFGMLNNIRNLLQCHIIVSPTGYQNSWNICGEGSDAPDVAMIVQLVDTLKTFSNVRDDHIRLLGSSNGAALTNRIFIESNDEQIDGFVAIVSQLTGPQYQENEFYGPSGMTDPGSSQCGYDSVMMVIPDRKYLSVCNVNDPVIPYEGGNSVGTSFHPAPEAAFYIAQSQGYPGNILTGPGIQIGATTVFEYSYLSGQVVLLKGEAAHGMDFTQRDYIRGFLRDCEVTTSVEEKYGYHHYFVYPNPATDRLNIRLEPFQEKEDVQLFTIEGKLLLNKALLSGENVIDLSGIKAGVYILSIGGKSSKLLKI